METDIKILRLKLVQDYLANIKGRPGKIRYMLADLLGALQASGPDGEVKFGKRINELKHELALLNSFVQLADKEVGKLMWESRHVRCQYHQEQGDKVANICQEDTLAEVLSEDILDEISSPPAKASDLLR